MKRKIILIISLVLFVGFFSGITYSFFNSGALLKSNNQGIASFIFETNKVDYIELNLNDLLPGDEKSYLFSVMNNKGNKVSDVTVEYQLKIKTFHFIPLNINLYEIKDGKEEFVGTCDETSSRNEEKELVCNMPIKEFKKNQKEQADYKLKIDFLTDYNDEIYSNLVDYIKIEVESWQKI